jgi:hypothetical protein
MTFRLEIGANPEIEGRDWERANHGDRLAELRPSGSSGQQQQEKSNRIKYSASLSWTSYLKPEVLGRHSSSLIVLVVVVLMFGFLIFPRLEPPNGVSQGLTPNP